MAFERGKRAGAPRNQGNAGSLSRASHSKLGSRSGSRQLRSSKGIYVSLSRLLKIAPDLTKNQEFWVLQDMANQTDEKLSFGGPKMARDFDLVDLRSKLLTMLPSRRNLAQQIGEDARPQTCFIRSQFGPEKGFNIQKG